MTRDRRRAEQCSRCRALGNRKSSPCNEIRAHPRQLLEQIWISKRYNDRLSAALNERLHKICERLGRARANRIPALSNVRADDRLIRGIRCRDQSRVVESGVFGGDELRAQFW